MRGDALTSLGNASRGPTLYVSRTFLLPKTLVRPCALEDERESYRSPALTRAALLSKDRSPTRVRQGCHGVFVFDSSKAPLGAGTFFETL